MGLEKKDGFWKATGKKRTSDNYLIKALSGPGRNLVGKHMH